MKVYTDWSPSEAVRKFQSAGKLNVLIEALRASLLKQTGHKRGSIAVAVCGEEDAIVIKQLGYNTVWIAFPTEEELNFVFYEISSMQAGLNGQEMKSVQNKLLGAIVNVVEKEGPFQDWRI